MPSAPRPTMSNREELDEFRVEWNWVTAPSAWGFTAVLRVRDEARSLPWVLPGVLRSSEHVVLVDNGSTDGTAKVAAGVADDLGLSSKLTLLEYPFEVSRCGSEHLATYPDSVHSLTYYYNWCFSQVRTSHALKWDGDMVLTQEGEQLVRALNWQLGSSDVCVRGHHAAAYVLDDQTSFVDLRGVFREFSGWPNDSRHRFMKGFDFERIRRRGADPIDLPASARFELKWLDEDEFSHWSLGDLESGTSTRKRREWLVFNALREGGPLPHGVEKVVSTNEHVIRRLQREYPRMLRRGAGRRAP